MEFAKGHCFLVGVIYHVALRIVFFLIFQTRNNFHASHVVQQSTTCSLVTSVGAQHILCNVRNQSKYSDSCDVSIRSDANHFARTVMRSLYSLW